VNLPRRPGGALAFLLLMCALAAAGCGATGAGGGNRSEGGSVVTIDTSSAGSAYPQAPTAAQLDAQFRAAIDPTRSDSARTALVQDGEDFRAALPDLYRALRENPNAKYGIDDPVFDNHDGSITATMRMDRDGTGSQVQALPVHFLALDGRWKLSRQDLCGVLAYADYHTPACD